MSVLPHGWVRFEASDWPGATYLRFEPDTTGRWTIREVYLDGDGATFSPQMLRDMNWAFLESWAQESSDDLAFRYNEATPGDLSVLASWIGTHIRVDDDERLAQDWIRLAYVSSFDREVREASGFHGITPPKKKRRRSPAAADRPGDFRLTRGPGPDGITDAFLGQVRDAYNAALARRERPNQAIHRDLAAAGEYVGKRTVEGWVAEARRRGIMPKGRKGAAG